MLERWARRPKSALVQRRRIVQAAADGERRKEIAVRLGYSTQTAGRGRGRFARHFTPTCSSWPTEPRRPRRLLPADQ